MEDRRTYHLLMNKFESLSVFEIFSDLYLVIEVTLKWLDSDYCLLRSQQIGLLKIGIKRLVMGLNCRFLKARDF